MTLLVGLTALFAIHPPPIGPAALVRFAAAAVLIERRWALQARPKPAVAAEPKPVIDVIHVGELAAAFRGAPVKTSIIQNEPDEPNAPVNLRRATGRVKPSHQPRRAHGPVERVNRKTAIFGWLAFVVVAFALGIVSGTTKIDQDTSGVGESGRIDKLLHRSSCNRAGESVLIQSETLTVKDPAFTAAVEDVIARVSAVDVVMDVKSPLDPENAGQIGQAGSSAIDFEIRGDPDDALTKIDPAIAAVDEAKAANPDVFIGSFGVSGEKEVEAALDDPAAGRSPIRRRLIILIVVFERSSRPASRSCSRSRPSSPRSGWSRCRPPGSRSTR